MSTFRILSKQFQHYVDSCNALSSLPRNILQPTNTAPIYAVIQMIANKPGITDVQLEYAQHIIVLIFANIVGATAKEAIMLNIETKTPIAYTMGVDKPLRTAVSIDSDFDKNIRIETRKAIIDEITIELSKLIDCDARNPGGSIKFDHSSRGIFGVDEYIVERVAVATPKVYQTRSALE